MSIELIVESAMCVLLVLCVGYGYILNRHLNHFRAHQSELSVLFDTFSQAIARAQQGVQDLKKSAEDAGGQLLQRIDAAQKLVSELEFLVGRAEAITGALEKNAKAAKQVILEQNRETHDKVQVVKPHRFAPDDEREPAILPYTESRKQRKGPLVDSDESFDLLKSIEKLR